MTRVASLERFCYADAGTFGNLQFEGACFATVERPWLGNAPSVSCIPIGVYRCVPSYFYRGGYSAVELLNVPDRTLIKMHRANYPLEVNGCIGINRYHGAINDIWCGKVSRLAFDRFIDLVDGSEFELEIFNKEGGIL